jgi:hypothetical protein
MPLQVRKGDVWFAGIDKPVVVSWGTIDEALKGMGLRLLDHFERDERSLPFDPRTLSPYADDWDEVAVIRVERGQELDVPDRVKWAKLTERTTHTTSAGAEAGEAADLAAEAATRRAAERRERQGRALAVLAVVLVGSGVAAVVLAKRRTGK